MDRVFNGALGGFVWFLLNVSIVFFSTSISEVNKFPIYLGFSKCGVKLGFIHDNRDNNVEDESFSCDGCLIVFKAPQFNSLRTGSPRHSFWICFL